VSHGPENAVAPSWEQARRALLKRLEEVGRLLELEDEAAVLRLVNRRDEFCRAADERREHAHPARRVEATCHFCEGFIQSGGCVGMLARLNHEVMTGDWDEAQRVNGEYIRWVQNLELHA
jgi:hypothetical protein